mmetsp:Transcript_8246/g.16453  ORF Transcript_8246/g.16453 Transcript_8246/m.16453 type:complete len:109 (+) Transcript_8246:350-676(+)
MVRFQLGCRVLASQGLELEAIVAARGCAAAPIAQAGGYLAGLPYPAPARSLADCICRGDRCCRRLFVDGNDRRSSSQKKEENTSAESLVLFWRALFSGTARRKNTQVG